MKEYKIKIQCTEIEELILKGKKIRNKSLPPYNLYHNNDYIDEIIILYKKFITTTSLEFFCNRKITIDEFQYFIKQMHYYGYYSHNDINIQFIENKNNSIIYNYKFQSISEIKSNYNNYKIKIKYKDIKDLKFNNKQINNTIYSEIYSIMEHSNIKYTNNFMLIDCHRKLCDNEFKNIIKKMHSIGFYSENNINIYFISNKTEIYNYTFQTIKKINKNKYIYKRIKLF